MKNKKLVISLIVAAVFLAIVFLLFFLGNQKAVYINPKGSAQNQNIMPEPSPQEIMQIIKTDKDYNDFSDLVKNFNPEIAGYIKLEPEEYAKIKPEWQKQGFGDRVAAIDKIKLTDSTYWVELKNKNDETKGLRALLDLAEKKSLFLAGSISINASVGL